MESLMELTDEYKQLLDMADAVDEEEQQCFLDTLEGLDYEVGLKADAYASVMAAINSRIEMYEKEITRLQQHKKSLEGNVEKMKDTLKLAMETMNKNEIQGDFHKFKLVKNGGKLPMIITGEIPDNYKKLVFEDDKAKIREDLESGIELDFAHLGDRGTHLKID